MILHDQTKSDIRMRRRLMRKMKSMFILTLMWMLMLFAWNGMARNLFKDAREEVCLR